MDTMNFENVLSPDEMLQVKGGHWVLTENGWEWHDDTKSLDNDDWNL